MFRQSVIAIRQFTCSPAARSVITFNNGMQLPPLAFGTWRSKKAGEAVSHALRVGYRHVDCAAVYENEELVGDALHDAFNKGIVKRSDLVIESKLWNIFHQPKHVLPALQDCLSRLRLDYLDLFIIHWPVAFPLEAPPTLYPKDEHGNFRVINVPIEDTWRAMEDLLPTGLVRAIGVSNFTVSELDRILRVAKVAPAVNQFELHPLLPRRDLVQQCTSNGVAVQAYSPLGSPSLKRGPVLLQHPTVVQLAQRRNCTPAQLLLRYGIQRGAQPIAKSETPSRIEENFAALKMSALTEEEMATVNGISERFRFVAPLWRNWDESV